MESFSQKVFEPNPYAVLVNPLTMEPPTRVVEDTKPAQPQMSFTSLSSSSSLGSPMKNSKRKYLYEMDLEDPDPDLTPSQVSKIKKAIRSKEQREACKQKYQALEKKYEAACERNERLLQKVCELHDKNIRLTRTVQQYQEERYQSLQLDSGFGDNVIIAREVVMMDNFVPDEFEANDNLLSHPSPVILYTCSVKATKTDVE